MCQLRMISSLRRFGITGENNVEATFFTTIRMKIHIVYCKSCLLCLNVQWNQTFAWYNNKHQTILEKISLVCCYLCCTLLTIQMVTIFRYSTLIHIVVPSILSASIVKISFWSSRLKTSATVEILKPLMNVCVVTTTCSVYLNSRSKSVFLTSTNVQFNNFQWSVLIVCIITTNTSFNNISRGLG